MADVREVVVPDIGDFSDVPVIEVLVSEGDSVAPEDPLVTLESDKATMDVPAPFAGTVAELKVSVGDTVSEGSLLLTLSVDGNGAQPAGQPAATPTAPATEAGAGQAHAIEDVQAEPSADGGPERQEPASPQAAPADAEGPVPPYASPSVRRLAREQGVDLSQVSGSGRKGRITKEDVETAASAPAAAPKAAAAAPSIAGLNLAPWPSVDFEKFGPIERRPLSRIQKISGPTTTRRTSPSSRRSASG
jgi:pyruvate dehydrogenase E2 component (dihydrolipoamide acetyltransferase)